MPHSYIDYSKMKTEDIHLIQSLLADQHNKRTGPNVKDLPLVLPKTAEPPEPFAQPNAPNTEVVQEALNRQLNTEQYNKRNL